MNQLSAEKKENAHPELGQERNAENHGKFSKIKTRNGDWSGHQYIPVVISVFQTPKVGTVKGNQRSVEKTGIKQCELCPQRVPAASQNADILLIIEGAHNRRNNGNQNAGRKNDGVTQFDIFGVNTTKQHVQASFLVMTVLHVK